MVTEVEQFKNFTDYYWDVLVDLYNDMVDAYDFLSRSKPPDKESMKAIYEEIHNLDRIIKSWEKHSKNLGLILEQIHYMKDEDKSPKSAAKALLGEVSLF